MRQVPLFLPFCIASFFALFGSALFPEVKLLFFTPFLALLYNRFPFHISLWMAALCGLFIDLLSSEFRLGFHTLSYSLTTFVLYHQKRHFFEDKPLAFSLFTLLISGSLTTLELLLISIFGQPLPLSKKLLITDALLLPIADSCYAFVCFSCPMMFYLHIKKVGLRAFWNRLIKPLRVFRKKEKEST